MKKFIFDQSFKVSASMPSAPIPAKETERLAALREYNILDSLSEKDYDDITSLAATISETPISLITFVDENRQWFKSHFGTDISETLREYSFCAHALNAPDKPLIVEDSREDVRFSDNPLVTGEPHVIFYTGMPLVDSNGYALGTLCVLDLKPKRLSPDQLSALETLSKHVVSLLEVRKSNAILRDLKEELETRNRELEQFASVVSHDIKSPLSSIAMANQILADEFGENLGEEGKEVLSVSTRSAEKINALVEGILSYYQSGDSPGEIETFNITEFFDSLFSILPPGKNYKVDYPKSGESVTMNRTQLEQIFINLINNSIRYHDNNVIELKIGFSEAPQQYFFSLTDNGIGIAKENQDKIFTLFTRIDTNIPDSKTGYGIGLSTVKKIIERNGGIITLDSGLGKGTTFSFNIKKNWKPVS